MTRTNCGSRAFSKTAIVLAVFCSPVLLVFTADLFLLDRYVVTGTVKDATTGKPVTGAEVLISIGGVEPRRPFPHTGGGGMRCIAGYVRQTDSTGRFFLDELGRNQMLVDKGVTIQVFKPGWYQSRLIKSQIAAGLLGSATELTVPLNSDKGERWSFIYNSHSMAPVTLRPESESYQKTMSKALTSQAVVANGQFLCDEEGLDLSLTILAYVASNARTDDERHYILLRCAELQGKVAFLAKRTTRWSVFAPTKDRSISFPLKCDSSLFSHDAVDGVDLRDGGVQRSVQ